MNYVALLERGIEILMSPEKMFTSVNQISSIVCVENTRVLI
jgi:hypothetical protein